MRVLGGLGFLQFLRKKCDENGIVLIVDEVMAGFCRTGKWWGFEHAGIVPDIISTPACPVVECVALRSSSREGGC